MAKWFIRADTCSHNFTLAFKRKFQKSYFINCNCMIFEFHIVQGTKRQLSLLWRTEKVLVSISMCVCMLRDSKKHLINLVVGKYVGEVSEISCIVFG